MDNMTLYKKDTKGKIRVWIIERMGNAYQIITGLHDGKRTSTEPTICTPKNIGRSNETTGEQQAKLEVDALYEKKLKRGYAKSIAALDDVDLFLPMKAVALKKVKPIDFSKPVFSQPKLDGIRCIARANGLWTRTGQPIGIGAKHIWDGLQPLFQDNPNLILDGELYNHELKEDFGEIVSLIRKTKPSPERLEDMKNLIEYHIYDTPISGVYYNRYVELLDLFTKYGLSKPFRMVDTRGISSAMDMDVLEEMYLSSGYEGQIIRLNSEYKPNYSNSLIKRKVMIDEEFTILDIMEGKGNWAGCAKRVLLDLGNGITSEAGMRGTQEFAQDLLLNKAEYIGGDATTQYFGKTPDGALRHGVVKVFFKTKRDM